MKLVMKFGGTSVGSAEAIQRTAGLVQRFQREWTDVIVVASAMSGVTDLLTRAADASAAGDSRTCRSGPRAAAQALSSDRRLVIGSRGSVATDERNRPIH